MMKPSSVPCNVRWIAQVHMDFSESAMERAARPTWSHSKVLESNTGQQCPKGQINEMWLSFMTKKRPINSLLGSRVFTKKSVLLKFYQREKTTPKLLPKVHFFFFFNNKSTHSGVIFRRHIQKLCGLPRADAPYWLVNMSAKPGHACCHCCTAHRVCSLIMISRSWKLIIHWGKK